MKREYTNAAIERAINDRVHNARYRALLKDRLINGKLFKELAEEYGYSIQHTKRIVYQFEDKIFD